MSIAIIPREVITAAQRSMKKWRIYASVTCAQWALESAWGAHMSGKNNPFGIKTMAGQPGTVVNTHEVINGVSVPMKQTFADYASLDEAFDAHGKLLATGSHYATARTFLAKKDAEGFAQALTGHYATDPQYGSKLISVMRAHGLYSYDDLDGVILPVEPPKHIDNIAVAPAKPGFWARFVAALTGRKVA